MKLRRASFRDAISWIAFNDEPTVMDTSVIATLITVALIADLFGTTVDRVAFLVMRKRRDTQRASALIR